MILPSSYRIMLPISESISISLCDATEVLREAYFESRNLI